MLPAAQRCRLFPETLMGVSWCGEGYHSTIALDRLRMGQWLIESGNIRAQLAQQALSQCPNTKVILSGYSQGGQLVHNAAKLLPAETAQKIAGAVTFGDPGTYLDNLPPSHLSVQITHMQCWLANH